MKLTIKKLKRGETPMRKSENFFVNNVENGLNRINKEMVKISWGGKSLEVRNRDSFKTNFYVDDA